MTVYRITKAPNLSAPVDGYDLRLMFIDTTNYLVEVDDGRSLVIVALVGHERDLHIRIFDATGQQMDFAEDDLINEEAATQLRERLDALPDEFDESDLSWENKQQIIANAMDSVGYTPRDVGTPVDIALLGRFHGITEWDGARHVIAIETQDNRVGMAIWDSVTENHGGTVVSKFVNRGAVFWEQDEVLAIKVMGRGRFVTATKKDKLVSLAVWDVSREGVPERREVKEIGSADDIALARTADSKSSRSGDFVTAVVNKDRLVLTLWDIRYVFNRPNGERPDIEIRMIDESSIEDFPLASVDLANSEHQVGPFMVVGTDNMGLHLQLWSVDRHMDVDRQRLELLADSASEVMALNSVKVAWMEFGVLLGSSWEASPLATVGRTDMDTMTLYAWHLQVVDDVRRILHTGIKETNITLPDHYHYDIVDLTGSRGDSRPGFDSAGYMTAHQNADDKKLTLILWYIPHLSWRDFTSGEKAEFEILAKELGDPVEYLRIANGGAGNVVTLTRQTNGPAILTKWNIRHDD